MGLPGSKNACEQGECGSCTVYLDGVTCCACLVAAGQAEGRERRHRRGLGSATAAAAPGAAGVRRRRRRAVRLLHPRSGGRGPRPAAARPRPRRRRDPRGAGRQPVPLHRLREDHRRRAPGRRGGCDEPARDRGLRGGHHGRRPDRARRGPRRRRGRPDRRGRRRAGRTRRDRLDGRRTTSSTARGCLATPGLVNTHHHLYQWLTRGFAVDHTLFGWLTTLYPVWAGLDEDSSRSGATGALGSWLAPAAPPRPTTTTSSRPTAATCSAPRSTRPARSACGSTPPAARWTSGRARAGCPRTTWSRRPTRSSTATRSAIDRAPRPLARLDAAGRRRAVLAVLGHRRPARGRRPRWPATRASGCTPTSPRPSTRTTSAGSASAARRSSTSSRSAGSATTSGSPTASTSTTPGSPSWPRPAPASRTARPPTPGSGAGICRTRDLRGRRGARSGSASTGRRPTRRLAGRGAAPRGAPRPRRRRARRRSPCATGWSWPRSAARGCSAGTTRSAPSRSASSPTSRCGGVDTAAHAGIDDPVAALVLGLAPAAGAAAGPGAPGRASRRDGGGGRGAAARSTCSRATTSLLSRAGTMTDAPRVERRPTSAAASASAAAARRHAEGERRVRLRLRPLDGRHALGRHPAQPAPLRPDPNVDLTAALATPGVFAVLTHEDVPGAKCFGLEHRDQPVLAIDVVRYQGEPVALVAADHPETARRAAKRIVVDYDVLDPVVDAEEALLPDSPRLHPRRQPGAAREDPHGDPHTTAAGGGLRRLRGRHAGPGVPRPGVRARRARRHGGVDLFVATQWLHVDRARSARRSGSRRTGCGSRWPASAARSAAREDLSMHVHACLLALHTGKPVKMVYQPRGVVLRPRAPAPGARCTTSTAPTATAGWSTRGRDRPRRRRLRLQHPGGRRQRGHDGARALRRPERRTSTATAPTPTTRRAARCAASARCRPPSRSRR